MPVIRRPSLVAALRRILLPVLGAALLTGAFGATPASADDSEVTWGVRAVADSQSTERQNYAYDVDPGEELEDAIVITNHGTGTLALDLYAADGFTTSSGQLDALPRAETSVALGTWITPSTDQVEIPAGGSVEVAFTVAVPADATPGDYAGAILTSLVHAQTDSGVDVDRRLGIRVHLRVSGELNPALTVDQPQIAYTGSLVPFDTGHAEVTYTVHNTGNTRLSAGQQVVVAGVFGLGRIELHPQDVPELLPGESWTVTVPTDGVFPLLRLTAAVTLSPLSPDGLDSGTDLAAVHAHAWTWAVPWSQLALLLLVAGGTVLIVRTTRRRRAHREQVLVEAAVAQALRDRAAAAPESPSAGLPTGPTQAVEPESAAPRT